jgi:hypothetical protein
MNARTKLIGTVALGAALLVPVAQAQSPDDRGGLRGPGGIAAQQSDAASSHPDNRAVRGTGVAAESTNVAVRPDDRAGARGPGAHDTGTPATGAIAHPDNRAESRGPGSIDSVVVVSSSGRFDWADAMIGSLGGIGFVLLLMGGIFLLTSQRNKTRLA